jgi:hypothetical protein
MAKISGLGGTIQVMDATSTLRTITNDVTNYTWTNPRGVQDTTGVDKFAHEQLLLLADYSVTLNGVFNSAANFSHAVFATITTTTVVRNVSIAPTSNSGTPILAVNCVLTDYQITRSNTGELTWQVPGQLADGAVPTWA